jgi:DNA invertase Pin-like site-specific DNA recombinase
VRLVGYVRGSKDDQRITLDAQEARIRAFCAEQGHEVELIETDAGVSAKDTNRPGLERALARVREGHADGLIVAKLDRLSRSVQDAARLFQEAHEDGWSLVVLDPHVDTTTPYGRAFAQIAAVFAELERSLISQRTTEALAELKRQGVRLGSPQQIPDEVLERIAYEREQGLSLVQIALGLELDGVPNGRGEQGWTDYMVAKYCRRYGLPASRHSLGKP